MGVLEFCDRGIKLLALLHVSCRVLNGALCRTDRASGDINAATVQSFHCNGKTLTFFPQPIRYRDAYVVEGDHASGLGVPAHLVFFFAVLDALGIGRYQQGGDPFGSRIRGAGHHHQHIRFACS